MEKEKIPLTPLGDKPETFFPRVTIPLENVDGHVSCQDRGLFWLRRHVKRTQSQGISEKSQGGHVKVSPWRDGNRYTRLFVPAAFAALVDIDCIPGIPSDRQGVP